MKKVFISHPFASDPEGNREKEKKICKYVLKQGHLPISPLHLFKFIEEETPTLRENIMIVCKRLIDQCDEVWIFGNSRGCKEEERYAMSINKKVVKFYPEST